MIARTARAGTRRRWFAPEVVQTSSMDCGPAALKCLLEGSGIPVSYGRLREACQTGIDGTSIDTLETVAGPLGVPLEQVMLPRDQVLLDTEVATNLPAIMVVRQPDGNNHFVVVWRRIGRWVQVMDPALGRRWLGVDAFLDQVLLHQTSVLAPDWREWATSDEARRPLRRRLSRIGATPAACERLIDSALRDPLWFGIAALDASLRLVHAMTRHGALSRGLPAMQLLAALYQRTCAQPHDIFGIIPLAYWSVVPDPDGATLGEPRLLLRGAVLLRPAPTDDGAASQPDVAPAAELPAELALALAAPRERPWRTVFALLREDGLLAPLALLLALGLASATTLVEALLFRGLFDLAAQLSLPVQRLGAIGALGAILVLALLLQWPITAQALRHGRHLELRLRVALLRLLPRLNDRYFQSRPISDMAERNHAIHLVRQLPTLAIQFAQSVFELGLTVLGIAWIDPALVPAALMVVAIALGLPLLAQPWMNERDLRVRNHAGALAGFYLDALQGLVPIRVHRAQAAVRREHEGLLVSWTLAMRSQVRWSIATEGLQALLCVGIAAGMLIAHFLRAGGLTGADLLLVFWALKLPATAQSLAALAHQYPAQRNALLRLIEPLSAPQSPEPPVDRADARPIPAHDERHGLSLRIESGTVIAGGHEILADIDLAVTEGEHVAIVGTSGAGKSTLLGVLLGWHRLASGRVLVDGAVLDDTRLARMRRETAWVDPAITLWNRSVLDNLTYACDPDSTPGVERVIETARLRGVLASLPEGLQTHLGEGGARLSGGEGQRVRLARALMQADTRLVLLDEPFRGLDRGQRAGLLADARRWWARQTLLCVTHDIVETRGFDRVLVVEDGRIVEDGSPDTLLATDSHYRALFESHARAHAQLWRGRRWRHLHLHEGRLLGTLPVLDERVGPPATAAPLTPDTTAGARPA